jgi:tRNA threonylcarbamoyladenosine biosynthesis protein TsaE
VITARTFSVDDTRDLAATLADLCRAGDVVLLSGEMGVGKTVFAQGLGRGLGVEEQVTSPTFTIVRDYAGRLPLHHVDVYRLDHMGEVFDIGISELVDDGAVTMIEWGDVVVPAIPADYLEVMLTYGGDDSERVISLRTVGASWSARSRALWEAIDPWAKAAE